MGIARNEPRALESKFPHPLPGYIERILIDIGNDDSQSSLTQDGSLASSIPADVQNQSLDALQSFLKLPDRFETNMDVIAHDAPGVQLVSLTRL